MKRQYLLLIIIVIALIANATTLPSDSLLRRYAARMLMVGFKGDSVTDNCDAARYVRDLHVGCIVLFDIDLTGTAKIGSRNITSKERLKKMTSRLQEFSDQPLLIAADQEGGRVARLKPQYGFSPTVSAQYLGATDQEDTTRFYAARIACEMAESGVNLNLAPVVDVHNDSCPAIGKLRRGFSANPSKVAQHAQWFVDEHNKQHVACALKHFPGHGSSRSDSHYGLVDISTTWNPEELKPFKALIDNGMIDAIMSAHIYNLKMDSVYPATLSHNILTNLLRKELGYNGVLITDDMYMEGILNQYDIEDALVLAINAGADMMCVGNNINTGFEADRPFKLVDIIVNAVKDGKIPFSRIEEANRRIDRLCQRIK